MGRFFCESNALLDEKAAVHGSFVNTNQRDRTAGKGNDGITIAIGVNIGKQGGCIDPQNLDFVAGGEIIDDIIAAIGCADKQVISGTADQRIIPSFAEHWIIATIAQ